MTDTQSREYYDKQLSRIHSGAKMKLTDENGDFTNFLDLNPVSVAALRDWINLRFPESSDLDFLNK